MAALKVNPRNVKAAHRKANALKSLKRIDDALEAAQSVYLLAQETGDVS